MINEHYTCWKAAGQLGVCDTVIIGYRSADVQPRDTCTLGHQVNSEITRDDTKTMGESGETWFVSLVLYPEAVNTVHLRINLLITNTILFANFSIIKSIPKTFYL